MELQQHDLHHEFPEHREEINALKTSDGHFSKLCDEYHEVNRHVQEIEEHDVPITDFEFEILKKQRLRLKDLGIQLKPGIEYRWFVGMVTDPQQRSNDVIASGTIMRNEAPSTLTQKLAQSDKRAVPFIYAEEGYWYDAIATVSDLIAANPGDAALRQQRATLLEQAGLDEAARFDQAKP